MWDSMCHTAINLISNALHAVDNAEVLLKIKGVIALFIQTMDVGYNTIKFRQVSNDARDGVTQSQPLMRSS